MSGLTLETRVPNLKSVIRLTVLELYIALNATKQTVCEWPVRCARAHTENYAQSVENNISAIHFVHMHTGRRISKSCRRSTSLVTCSLKWSVIGRSVV